VIVKSITQSAQPEMPSTTESAGAFADNDGRLVIAVVAAAMFAHRDRATCPRRLRAH
jgi:hypothetical protein